MNAWMIFTGGLLVGGSAGLLTWVLLGANGDDDDGEGLGG